ncbi:MAG: hypothetical protein KAR47_00165 [Planctomycetes bacterium]|nr:hypothetical protein [Planctomycetota bacterium]
MKIYCRDNRFGAKGGFTLLEALLAMVLIGISLTSIVASMGAYTQVTGVGLNLSTAEFLIEEIRELSAALPAIDPDTGIATFGVETGEGSVADYDDLDDFDGQTFSPPVDVSGTALTAFSAFSQQVVVENVSASDFENVVSDHSSDFVRVTVSILLNGNQVSSASWIRARL